MKTFTLFIDGKRYEVDAEGKNLLHTCLSLGLNLPYFCWHPALHSVGACRQCAVKLFKDEADTRGRIVMSCMTPVTDGMRLSIEDPEARAFRGQITEWLMVNHPHDCPICDEGGECHLQDMVVMTGHAYRRYRFTKRTHVNQDLGPFLNHEMNRCIECYRCVRFYRDYAGGTDLEVLGAHDDVFFGRQTEGTLENEFSGNLVEVCPTGVFTDKTLKAHYTRKWDLQTAPSVCVHCAVGCNTIPGERYGTLRRVRTRYNGEVNGYFLCDRGRYGYEFVNGEQRLRQALTGGGSAQTQTVPDAALAQAVAAVGTGKAIGIGSPRASLESNFALRSLVGPGNFYLGVPDARFALQSLMIRILREGPAASASIHQAAGSDAVLVLGEDVWNTAPILALNLRQASMNVPLAVEMKQKKLNRWDDAAVREAIRHQKGPFFVASVEETKLDEVSRESHRLSPADIAGLGNAIAHELDATAPDGAAVSAELRQAAHRIAEALRAAEHPLIVTGAGLGSTEVVQAAANVSRALVKAGRAARISLVFPEANSFGATLMASGGLEAAGRALQNSGKVALIVMENDPFRALPESSVQALFAGASQVILIDHTATPATKAAHIVLPATTYAESSGTMVSSEGRAQRFFSVMPAIGTIRDSWRWLSDIAAATGRKALAWRSLDELIDAMIAAVPDIRGVREAAPRADFRINGSRIPRKSLRESGRTAVTANIDIHEPRPAFDLDSPLAYSMEGVSAGAPSSMNARFWSPGWNSDQSLNKFQAEVGGQLVGGDPGIRLIEPPAQETGAYYVPTRSPDRASGALLLVPSYHVFGSEELSSLAAGVASRIAQPVLALSASQSQSLGLREGQTAHLTTDQGIVIDLPVTVRAMPDGVASIPAGYAALPQLASTIWARPSGGAK